MTLDNRILHDLLAPFELARLFWSSLISGAVKITQITLLLNNKYPNDLNTSMYLDMMQPIKCKICKPMIKSVVFARVNGMASKC